LSRSGRQKGTADERGSAWLLAYRIPARIAFSRRDPRQRRRSGVGDADVLLGERNTVGFAIRCNTDSLSPRVKFSR